MTRGRAVIFSTALVALVGASAALAAGSSESIRLSGGVPGDSDSIVRVSTVQKDGETTVVKRFRFKKVLATCDGSSEPQRISVKLTGRIPVTDREYKRTFDGGANGTVKVEGRVSRTGERTVGVVRSPAIAVVGVGVCKVPPTAFRAGV